MSSKTELTNYPNCVISSTAMMNRNPKLGMTDHYKITKQSKNIFYDGTLIRPRGLGRYIAVPTTTTTTTTTTTRSKKLSRC